jgi:large subunit ribosomal protein L4
MPSVPVYNLERKKVGSVELSESVYAAPVKEHLFHDVVIQQRASQRSGTASTKSLSAVSGTAKKPFRQKGTGRARQGKIRAPNQRTGGVVFGPTPRSYAYSLPKKVRKAALRSALSRRLSEGHLLVLDAIALPRIKTRDLLATIGKLEVGSTLFVDAKNQNLKLSARNIPHVGFVPVEGVGLMDTLRHSHLVLSRDAALRLDEKLKP